MNHPATGPISPDELKSLAELPHGKAAEALRKHDPFYGRTEGATIPWKVRLTRDVHQKATITVMAASQEEAEDLAEIDALTADWDTDNDNDFDIVEVVPA